MDLNREFPVLDFAYRTQQNLAFIEMQVKNKSTSNGNLFEVTQLINSMLGLLVFPKESFWNKEIFKDKQLSDLVGQGWPKIEVLIGGEGFSNLNQLITYLRNSIAHFNLDFTTSNGQISGLEMWNLPPHSDTIIWKIRLSIQDLRKLTEKFIELLQKEYFHG